MSAVSTADWGVVENVFERRRQRLDMTIGQMAEEAGINRDTVSAIEQGAGSTTTRGKYAAALDRLEADLNLPPIETAKAVEPPAGRDEGEQLAPGVFRFTVEGVYGAKAIILEGPPEDREALEAMVDRIMRNLQRGQDDSEGTDPRP